MRTLPSSSSRDWKKQGLEWRSENTELAGWFDCYRNGNKKVFREFCLIGLSRVDTNIDTSSKAHKCIDIVARLPSIATELGVVGALVRMLSFPDVFD